MSYPSNEEITIAYVLDVGGTATEGTDFVLVNSSPLVIDAGETTAMIPITIRGDTNTTEGEETIILNMTATNAIFVNNSLLRTVTGTITDYPIVSIETEFDRVSDSDYVEFTLATSHLNTGSVSVNLDVNTDADMKVDATNSNLTSINLTNSSPTYTGRIQFAANSARNSLVEIGIRSGGTSYSINPLKSQISFQVSDGSRYPAISIEGNGAVIEGNDASFTVSTDESDLTRRSDLVVAIEVSEERVTNFISGLPPKMVTIPSGTTSTTFAVPTLRNLNISGSEGVITAIILPGANYKLSVSKESATVLVNEIKLPEISIANTKFYVSEDAGNTGFNLELVLSDVALHDVSIDYAVTAGTAVEGTDFSITGDNVVFVANSAETSKIIPISIIDNDIKDRNKTIRFTLSNLVGAEFTGGGISLTRTIVIVDDEQATFSLSTTDFNVDEDVAGGKIDVGITLTPASLYDVTYTVSTQDDTAEKGQDYTEINTQTFTIAAGSTTSTISIPILNDTDIEGEQSFMLNIENVTGAVITGNVETIQQPITIVDDEAITIFLDNILSMENIIEGFGDYTMNLNTSSVVNSAIDISFSTTALTATSGTDYIAPTNQTITIANGANDVSLSGFNIPNNPTKNGNKTFRIGLSITSGSAVFFGGLTQKQITMTIVDDDSLVLTTSRVGEQDIDEDVGNVNINYSLATVISSPITFNVGLSDGVIVGFNPPQANFGSDYGSVRNMTITIPAGAASGSFSIPILDDSIAEVREGFTVTLSNLTHAVFDDCDVTHYACSPNEESFYFFINENDRPTLSFTNDDFSIIEAAGGTHFVVNLELSSVAPNHVIFNFIFTDGTAIQGTDYSVITGFQAIRRGQTTNDFRIPIRYNSNYTGNKSFYSQY